jgi:Mg2+ and Co2+ transporter CorA
MEIMQRQEFIIELGGIIGTIHTYTRNPFMVGYTRELKRAIRKNDTFMTKIILDKVIDWYDEEIENISKDQYVFNKNMHQKAYNILLEYRQSLQS